MVNRGTALANQIAARLKAYYPQALDCMPDLKTPMICDFLIQWPSLESVQRAVPEELAQFYWEHNCHSRKLIQRRIYTVQSGSPLTKDEAVITASVLMVRALASQLKVLLTTVKELEKEIEDVFRTHPNRALAQSLPGAGPAFAPRLAAVLGTDTSRFASAQELQQFSGIAPVTVRSGRQCSIRWRKACPKFCRQTFQEFAAFSIPHCSWARAYYWYQRLQGKKHQAALRALAYKWIRIIFRCWKDNTIYDDQKYLQALRRSNSPLMTRLLKPKEPLAVKIAASPAKKKQA